MKYINARMAGVVESATLAVMAKAQELRASGREIEDLSTGEPDMPTPAHIVAAAKEALDQGKTRYLPTAGLPKLRELVAERFSKRFGIPATSSTVAVTNGGKQALHTVFDVLLEPGDEVVLLAPYWVSFPAMVALSGGKSIVVSGSPRAGYRVTPDELARAISPRTRAVVLNSPSNPCGVGYRKEELAEFGRILARFPQIVVISDEVYESLTFTDFVHCSFGAACPELLDRTVTVQALSKSHAMTGWRVGFVTGPGELIKGVVRHQSQSTSNVNSIAQYAACAALTGDHSFQETMRSTLWKRMQRVAAALAGTPLAIDSLPQGAFYLFLRLEEVYRRGRFASSQAAAEDLLHRFGVAAVPGAAFGDDGALRISVGVDDATLDRAVARLVSWSAEV